MTITEIIDIENNRKQPDQFGIIHLIKEGNFYRAHDWSAWLMTTFPIGEAINTPLKISAKKLKDGYVEAWVGFPVTSIQKYIPSDDSVVFKPISENQIDVHIPLPEEYLQQNFDNIRNSIDKWKNQLPILDNKKSKREDHEIQEIGPRITRITDIVGSILSFSLVESSPLDAWEFIRKLQKQISILF